jgi:methylenetetrahydrofolate dehydrogenase (NADP+)/methenyltetrahydrofolate cyclohydrolase
MQVIDGKVVSQHIQDTLQSDIELIKSKGIIPTITIVQVGENQASCVYVRNKLRLCEKLQINGRLEKLEENVSEKELEDLIKRLNNDNEVNGILIQLPLPKHLDEARMIELINPKKDVDCFHLENVGSL